MHLSDYLHRFDVHLAILGYLCVSSISQYLDHFDAYLAFMRYQCVTERISEYLNHFDVYLALTGSNSFKSY